MENNNNAVETTTQSAAAEQGVENQSHEAPTENVDFAATLAALEEQTALRVKAESDRDNYKTGLLKAKGKLPEDEEEDIDAIIDKKVADKLSAIQTNLIQPTVDGVIASLSKNSDEQKLIKWHYENSIIKHGTDIDSIRADIDNAKMLANKNLIIKKTNERKLAEDAKNVISNISGGKGNEEDVKVEFFTPEQLNELTERAKVLNIDPVKFIQRTKELIQKQK